MELDLNRHDSNIPCQINRKNQKHFFFFPPIIFNGVNVPLKFYSNSITKIQNTRNS